MKKFIVILSIAIVIHGCVIDKNMPNHFSSSDDTLIIRTAKHKGDGLFSLGAMFLNLKDTATEFVHPVIYPKQLTKIKRMEMPVDFKAKQLNYVDFITGIRNNEEVLVVDENNNRDFSDDSIRALKQIRWRSNEDLIKCRYSISNGHQTVTDSSWLRIGTWHDNLLGGRSEHLIADFNLDNENYKIGIIDTRLFGFFYGVYPEAALLSHNIEIKDTLYQKDILNIGEFINLDGNYYRFENVNNNGEFITLIKEANFDKMIGTQVGLIAPEFKCKTVSGDTIISSKLNDRIMIIANSCECGGDSVSTQAYYDMKKEFGNEIYIFRLDSKIDKGLDGLQIDVNEKFNNDVYKKYRNEYCSRLCYVIGKNKRILDKFPVNNWRSNIAEYLNHDF